MKDLLDYFQAKLDDVRRNYLLALEQNDRDGVHDLRVTLKRLKAYFNLIEAVGERFDARKHFRNFRKIAKNTGGIRDAQVQQDLLKALEKETVPNPQGFGDYLCRKEGESIERFREFSRLDVVSRLDSAGKSIRKAVRDVSPVWAETKAFGRFHNLKSDMIILGEEGDLRNEVLHKVRILSKETHYTFEILQQCFHLHEDREDFITGIKKVHQVLGLWHDYAVCLRYLDEYRTEGETTGDRKTCDNMHRYIAVEKGKLKKKFLSVFREFCSTAVTL